MSDLHINKMHLSLAQADIKALRDQLELARIENTRLEEQLEDAQHYALIIGDNVERLEAQRDHDWAHIKHLEERHNDLLQYSFGSEQSAQSQEELPF